MIGRSIFSELINVARSWRPAVPTHLYMHRGARYEARGDSSGARGLLTRDVGGPARQGRGGTRGAQRDSRVLSEFSPFQNSTIRPPRLLGIGPRRARASPWEGLDCEIEEKGDIGQRAVQLRDTSVEADLDCGGTCTAPVSRSTSTKRVISTAGRFLQLTHVESAHVEEGGY